MPTELRILTTGLIGLIGLMCLAAGERARRAKARPEAPAVKSLAKATAPRPANTPRPPSRGPGLTRRR